MLAISTFNSLPDLWIEEPSANLSTVLNLRDNLDIVCEHDISPKTKPDVRVVYQYRSEVSHYLSVAPSNLSLSSETDEDL